MIVLKEGMLAHCYDCGVETVLIEVSGTQGLCELCSKIRRTIIHVPHQKQWMELWVGGDYVGTYLDTPPRPPLD